jgi:hypothetical protein
MALRERRGRVGYQVVVRQLWIFDCARSDSTSVRIGPGRTGCRSMRQSVHLSRVSYEADCHAARNRDQFRLWTAGVAWTTCLRASSVRSMLIPARRSAEERRARDAGWGAFLQSKSTTVNDPSASHHYRPGTMIPNSPFYNFTVQYRAELWT